MEKIQELSERIAELEQQVEEYEDLLRKKNEAIAALEGMIPKETLDRNIEDFINQHIEKYDENK